MFGRYFYPFGKLDWPISVTNIEAGFRPESGEHKGGHQSVEVVFTPQKPGAFSPFSTTGR